MSDQSITEDGDTRLMESGDLRVLEAGTTFGGGDAGGEDLSGTTLIDSSGNGHNGTYSTNSPVTESIDGLVAGDTAAIVQQVDGFASTDITFDDATFAGDFTIVGFIDDGGGVTPESLAAFLQASGESAQINFHWDNYVTGDSFHVRLQRIRSFTPTAEQSLFDSDSIAHLPAGRHMIGVRYTASPESCYVIVDGVFTLISGSTNEGALDSPMTGGAIGGGAGSAVIYDEFLIFPFAANSFDIAELWDDADDADAFAAKALSLSPANYYRFSTTPAPDPIVSSVSPNHGPTAGENTVTLHGTGLTGVTSVKFGGVDAESFTVDSDTQITATPAPHDGGQVHVTVF